MREKGMLTVLKVVGVAVFGWMVYIVVSTSLQSNLIKEWDHLAGIPWMLATLWDFYANALVLYLWICYKERSLGQRIVWLILTFLPGSIATAGYWLIQLFRLKQGEGLKGLVGGVHSQSYL
jgi:hypothetical protein